MTCLEEEKIIDPLTGKVGRYVQYACDGGAETGAWAGKRGRGCEPGVNTQQVVGRTGMGEKGLTEFVSVLSVIQSRVSVDSPGLTVSILHIKSHRKVVGVGGGESA